MYIFSSPSDVNNPAICFDLLCRFNHGRKAKNTIKINYSPHHPSSSRHGCWSAGGGIHGWKPSRRIDRRGRIDGCGEPALLGKQMSVFIDSYLDLNTHHEMPLLGQRGGVLDHGGIRSLANWLSSPLVQHPTSSTVAKEPLARGGGG